MVKAPFGWVADSKRPARLHASKECIEARNSPRTGKPVQAVPATRNQQEKLARCSFCFS